MKRLGLFTAALCLGSAVSAQEVPDYANLAESLHQEVLTKNVCYVTGKVNGVLIELGDVQVSRSDFSHAGYEGMPWVENALDIDIFDKFEAFGITNPAETVSFTDGKDTPNPEKETILAQTNGIPDVLAFYEPATDIRKEYAVGNGVLETYEQGEISRIYRLPNAIPQIDDPSVATEVEMLVRAFQQVLVLSEGNCKTS